MAFFDKEENYVGQLTTRLAKDTAQIQGASGFRLKTLVESVASLLTGVVVAFIFGWQLAFVILAIVPIIGLSAGIQMKFASGFSVSAEGHKGEAQVKCFIYMFYEKLNLFCSFPPPCKLTKN